MWKILWAYVILVTCTFVHGAPKVPCYFIFGDSLDDAGNNNALLTNAKANYPPYGVDFSGGVANGRFTNGRTIADVLTGLLGMEGFIPPFSVASGPEILKGVNYASGSGGIRPETGSQLGDRIYFGQQVRNHGITIGELKLYVNGSVSDYLNKCLYTVNIGSDDYINNYFMPKFYSTSTRYNPDHYATSLATRYERHLKALYSYGARKTAIFGLGLIGCALAEKRTKQETTCVEEINQAVQLFNKKLVQLVDYLNVNLTGAKFTFIDIIAMSSTLAALPDLTAEASCCNVGSDYQCIPFSTPCPNRNLYVFMDGYHLTEDVYIKTATSSFNSPSTTFVHPVDISTLLSM